ncbi:helix-turn-helix transcriptional regulator [Pseudomonas saudiphocaensis]|jgi:DNA-binding XRE family transcriptional regulator|uniref:XRE family transcriptional regulator n=1 Tax=Pseudomonas saudiphocaensis TaxID=1499686 RepID=A0A078LSX5_9PSED|nr:helix-turn-helix transcriptional regulator [Pseudomonas saudiphocaensis]MBE7928526.1 helix-turn-helix transcriptional regulator [Pseudomonas saudiphocaensis]CDZ92986.1 XRE family transcriptional regulator [Pseudomonas saudiphocaensis]
MNIQTIMRDGKPEYAVLAWADYQALLKALGQPSEEIIDKPAPAALPRFSELSALREAKGMSQEALARSVGISPVYLALIEQGERDPGDPIRRALARALEIAQWSPDA